jgi:glycosyltransferase involved in cell wall biosynthesis
MKALGIVPCVISTFHNLAYDCYPANTVFKRVRKWLDGYTARNYEDAEVAVSYAVAKHYEQHLKLKNMEIIPNCLSTKEIAKISIYNTQYIRELFGIKGGDIFIMCVGRFVPEKGHRLLIEAINMLRLKNDHTFKLILVGSGPLLSEIQKQISQNELSEIVVVKEYVPYKELLKWIKEADIYVQPSIHEAFGIAVAEAMALGVPVIASEVDGLKELIIDEYNGILCDPYPGAIYQSIVKIISDEEKRQFIGTNARIWIKNNISTRSACDQWEEIYSRCNRIERHKNG